MEIATEKRKIQVLKKVEIFSDFSEAEFSELATICVECNFKKKALYSEKKTGRNLSILSTKAGLSLIATAYQVK